MNTDKIMQLKSSFDVITQAIDNSDIEFWYARDLMDKLGYTEWRNFLNVIEKAKQACIGVGASVDNHFVDSTKWSNWDLEQNGK